MVLWVECGAVGKVWYSGWSVVLWVKCNASSSNFIVSAMESGPG